VKGGSENSWVTINFVYERQAKNGGLTAVCAIDFGTHALQIQGTLFFFNGDWHEDQEGHL